MARTFVPKFLHVCYDLKRYVDRHGDTMEVNFVDSADVSNLESMKPILAHFASKWPPERETP